MEQQIIELLDQTRSAELVNSAEKELSDLSESPDFLPSLIAILSSSSVSENTRLSALIHARIIILNYWDSITEETKDIIKSSLLGLIPEWPVSQKKSLYHYAHLIISKTISANDLEWPDLPDIIFDLLSNSDETSCRTGLILANSLCGSIKQITKDNQDINEWAITFGNNLLRILVELFNQCENYEFLSLGFHCAARILFSNADFDFQSMIDDFTPIVEKTFTISNEDYEFSYNALKFSIQFTTRYITFFPENLLEQYFQVIQNMLPLEIPDKMKCYLLELLNKLFINPITWDFISENLVEFLAELLMPLYALSRDDVDNLYNNPEEFISDVFKSDNSNFEDIRSSISKVIFSLHEDHLEIVDACRIVAAQTYTNYIEQQDSSLENQIVLFASFQLFSSVSQFMNDIDPLLFTQFFTEIFPIFDSDDDIVRSAAFMLLSESSNFSAPPDFIIKCMDHVEDEFPIARYYALISVSGLLEKSKDISEVHRILDDSPAVLAIFDSLFDLSQNFHFSDIAKSVSKLINVFKSQILPHAMDIFSGLMHFLSTSSGNSETVSSIYGSISILVELVSNNQEALEDLSPTFYEDCLNALQNMDESKDFDLLLSATKEIIDLLPFTESMWNVAEFLIERMKEDKEISITEPVEIISSFIIKDENFEKEEIMSDVISFCIDQMNERMEEFHSWSIFALLAANIVMRLGQNSVQDLFEPLATMLINQIEQIAEGNQYISSLSEIATLINDLLLTDYNSVSQILGERFEVLIDFWLNNIIIPESIMTLITCYDQISSENGLLLRTVLAITSNIIDSGNVLPLDEFEEGYDFENFDFEEIDECAKSCPWFNFSDALIEFSNLLEQIKEKDPTFYSQFLGELPEDYEKKISEIPNFANMYAQKKIQSSED